MMREDQNAGDYNPEDDVRNRILGQQGAPVPDPVADPVYDTSPTPQAPDPSPSADPSPWDPGPQNQPEQQAITDPTPQAASPSVNPIPTNANGSQVGGGTPWAAGASAPGGAPAGYTWNADMASYEPTPGTPAVGQQAPSGPTGGPPVGGALTDPGFASQFVAWWGNQPGVNPSVKNDPNYWIGRFTSGAFGNDQQYAIARMMQAEGPPEAARAPAAQQGAPVARTAAPVAAPQSFSLPQSGGNGTQQTPQGLWNTDFINQIRQLLMSRLQSAGQPVDPNDPSITAPLTAARDEATRTSDKERTDLAENLYANGGLNTDAISQKIQQSGEKNALGLGSLRATLITRELASRKDELKSLLQMAVQSGDAQSAQAIQMQMAELDAQVKREGLGDDLAKYSAYLNTVGAQAVM